MPTPTSGRGCYNSTSSNPTPGHTPNLWHPPPPPSATVFYWEPPPSIVGPGKYGQGKLLVTRLKLRANTLPPTIYLVNRGPSPTHVIDNNNPLAGSCPTSACTQRPPVTYARRWKPFAFVFSFRIATFPKRSASRCCCGCNYYCTRPFQSEGVRQIGVLQKGMSSKARALVAVRAEMDGVRSSLKVRIVLLDCTIYMVEKQ